MIKVDVRMARRADTPDDTEQPVIKIEGQTVEPDRLRYELSRYVSDTRKTELLLDYSARVPHGVVVAIQDAARGAGIQKVHILVPREELERQ
jgi:biopolymer transport protein ExbD